MSEKVLVTGGSGLVGRAVIRHLLDAGRSVTAIARSDAARDQLTKIGAQPVPGDVLDPESLSAAMSGCEVVYHIAGVNAFCSRDPSTMFRVNVDGSRNVMGAASRNGVRRVVYTSSAATLGERRGTVGSELSPHRGSFMSAYERSKHEAETTVLEEVRNSGPDVVCVNPSSVQGPGRSGGTGKIFVAYLQGRLKVFVDTRVSLVDIDDCARGHLLAEAHGRNGERYVLNGASMTLSEMVRIIEQITGVHHRPRLLPGVVASAAAMLIELGARLRKKDPPVCREMVRTLLHGHLYDGSRAERELHLVYTPVEQTLRRTIDWLVAEGLAPGL